MLPRLPRSKAPPADAIPEVTPLTRSFRDLRRRLVADGWFDRSPLHEALHLVAWAACIAAAAMLAAAPSAALRAAAFAPLGLSFVAAGWMAHDYIHGRGRFCELMRNFGGFSAGFSSTMWSEKHNRHHALTNHVRGPAPGRLRGGAPAAAAVAATGAPGAARLARRSAAPRGRG